MLTPPPGSPSDPQSDTVVVLPEERTLAYCDEVVEAMVAHPCTFLSHTNWYVEVVGCEADWRPLLPTIAPPRATNAHRVGAAFVPAGPVAPDAPLKPWSPVGPVKPVGPRGPVAPVGPVLPVAPSGPVGPDAPLGPC